MKSVTKKALLVTLLTSFIIMGSNCTGSVSVGAAYPGAWGYGPHRGYGGYGGHGGAVYVGGTVPAW